MKTEQLFAHNLETLEAMSKRIFKELKKQKTEKELLCVGETKYKVIACDIEVIKQEGCIMLFGFYAPDHNLYFAVKAKKKDLQQYIIAVAKFLDKFLKFVYWDEESKAGFQFLLIGHNVTDYDLPTIFTFIRKRSFDLVLESTAAMFDDSKRFAVDHPARRQGFWDMYQFLRKSAVIDTLSTGGKNDGNKYQSLFAFKIRLYFQEKVTINPLEYHFDFTKYSDHGLLKYNFNDLVYTYVLFLNYSGLQLLKTRTLLYSKFDISVSFHRSLSKSNAAVNTQHFAEVGNLEKKEEPKEIKVFLKDLVLLHDYHYKDEVYATLSKTKLHLNSKHFLKDLGPEENRTISFKGSKLKYGKGGLHSTGKEVGAKEKLPYTGVENMCAKSDDEFLIITLDFQSFYVNIVEQLFKKTDPENVVGKEMVEFNKQRLLLKKAKDPQDIVFKISNLAYTGSLNVIHSPVYDPFMYFSMTVNGQFLCLELLNFLKDIIIEVIDANTDGVIIFLKKENFNAMHTLCDQFEEAYALKIDTRDVIEYGLFQDSNSKIYKVKDQSDFIIKGRDTDLGFGFTSNVICSWLENLQNDYFSSSEELYDSFLDTFLKMYMKEEFSSKELLTLISINKIKDFGYALCYFSKKPNSHYGFYGKKIYNFKSGTIKSFFFDEKETNWKNAEHLVSTISKDLCFSGYWNLFTEKVIEKKYFKFLNNFHSQNKNEFVSFHQHKMPNTVKSKALQKKHSLFVQQIALFENKYNLHLFPKDANKMSFGNARLKGSHQQDFDVANTKNKISYEDFLVNNYSFPLYKAAALSLNLKRTYDMTKIVCLDIDNPAVLFRANDNIIPFLKLFIRCKKEGFFCFSSPTDSPFDRFKVLIKLEHIPEDLQYADLKKLKKDKKLDFFDFEDFASIFGQNLKALEIIQFHKEILSYSYEEILKTAYVPAVKENQPLGEEQTKLLVELFEERSASQRFYYQQADESRKNYLKLDVLCNRDSFFNVFYKTIQKKNLFSLNKENFVSFYQFEYLKSADFSTLKSLKGNEYKREEKKLVKKALIKKTLEDEFEFDLDQNSILFLQQSGLQSNNISLEDDKALLFYEMLFKRVNKVFNTSFVYTTSSVDSHGNTSFLFHSPCQFHEDDENAKAVTIYINRYGFATINCYHRTCKEADLHRDQINQINENVFALHSHFIEDLFEEVNDKLDDIIQIE